ncbi:mitochondrial ribosomal protein subunit L20-domain-containing protein [Aspergillus coremiiformis]|uniref:Mitochondrial ribosomal protein subunit L20-domain-containing protein n=1 Tax=Aspergillus coremiiformis TaxID=138285 RepID=A0A5N6YTM5_9EURO|nr:mitochondrial ribosomal protein subunit L20-domain-containing protein [Aspergillus coremiiformis]
MATFSTPSKRSFLTLPFLFPPSCESVTLQARRHQCSYRRAKQRLRVRPDASFGASSTHSHEQIIHNPPSSAPPVHHTPTKFLPPDDIRRTLRGASVDHGNSAQLPSVFKTSAEKRYHLNPSDIEEIRKLRLSDPMSWSRWKLAKRFDCSPMFIAMVCEAAPQKKEIQKQVLEAVQSRWGAKRRMAREDRLLRKESWGRDE